MMINITDRELLENAAKAAGIIGEWKWFADGALWLMNRPDFGNPWNPVIDDGDALRLAVHCAQMFGFYRFLRAWLIAMATEQGSPSDPYLATRRAIVKAAAKFGRNMK